ncbi:TRAP transporter small permease [Aestuariibius sp. HNIBRBA575]|uniref:TRAP transporter small permease n=1 Tax=Aestuariibius sp. HNIBRBA575 TaxID=3233343 RepID=UPI0034A248CB
MASLIHSAYWLQRKLEEIACYVSALAVASMMMITVVEVMARALFSKSLPGAYEYVSLLFVYLIYLGLGFSQRRDAHITVGLVYDHIPRPARKTVQAIYLLVACVFFAALSWTSAVSAWTNYSMGDTILGIVEVKTWWARAGIPIGLALFSLRFLIQLSHVITKDVLLEEAAKHEFATQEPDEDEKKL